MKKRYKRLFRLQLARKILKEENLWRGEVRRRVKSRIVKVKGLKHGMDKNR